MRTYIKNIKLNYIFVFIKDLNFSHGIWMLFLAARGLSLFEIGSLEAIFHIISFLMETPTGAVADLFGRKMSRLVGLLFSIISSVLIIMSTGYMGYAVSFVFSALSYNFESGAGEALVYDSLLIEKKEKQFMRITGRLEIIFQVTAIIGLIVGGYIGNYNYILVFYAALVVSAIAFVIGLFFKEPPIPREKLEKKPGIFAAIKKQYIDSFMAIRNNPKLAYIIVMTTFVCAGGTVEFFYIQLSLKQVGYQPSLIGIYLAVATIFAAAGAYFAERIDQKFGERRLINAMSLLIIASVGLCYFTEYAVIPLALMSFADSVLFVATRDYINKIILSDKRATILSFESMAFSFSMILIFPLFGWISDRIGIPFSFLGLCLLMLLLFLYSLRLKVFSKKSE